MTQTRKGPKEPPLRRENWAEPPRSNTKRAQRCCAPASSEKPRDGDVKSPLRQNRFAVGQRGAGFGLVVVPEPERLELLLFRPHLVERLALEEFAVFLHPVNRVRVVDVVERVLVHDDQVSQLARLD